MAVRHANEGSDRRNGFVSVSFRRVGFTVVTIAMLAGCSARASTPPDPVAALVTVEAARVPGLEPEFAGAGSVAATHTYRVAFEIAGRVEHVGVDVGDHVAAGSVLAMLDASDYRAQEVAAQAHLDEAQAQARKAFAGSRPQEKATARDATSGAFAQVRETQAGLALAQANAERSRRLFLEGAVAAQDNDAAVAAERSAQARVDAAQAQLVSARSQASLVNDGARQEDRDAARAQVAEARAARDLAANTVRKTAIVAPADAYVQQRDVEVGDETSPGIVAFTLTDAATPDVVVAVPEARASALALGMPARVTANQQQFAATVSRIEPAADPVTRTVQVRLRAAHLPLAPGTVVIAAIGARRRSGASIEVNALLTAADAQTTVAVVDASHTLRHRAVRVLSLEGSRALVTGIRPGDLVVTGGQYAIRAGERVTVSALPAHT